MDIHEAPEIMTVPQMAQVLGIAPNTLYTMCKRDEIPHRRVGRQIRFWRPEVIRWLATSA